MSRNRLRNPEMIHADLMASDFGAVTAKDVERAQIEDVVFRNRQPRPILTGDWSDGSAMRELSRHLHDLGIIDDQTEQGDVAEISGKGAVPTFTALAAAGATATTTNSEGTDLAGIVAVTPGGAGITTGSIISVVFAVPMGVADYAVLLTPRTSGARTLMAGGLGTTSHLVTSFDIAATVAPVSGTDYRFSYLVVPFH